MINLRKCPYCKNSIKFKNLFSNNFDEIECTKCNRKLVITKFSKRLVDLLVVLPWMIYFLLYDKLEYIYISSDYIKLIIIFLFGVWGYIIHNIYPIFGRYK